MARVYSQPPSVGRLPRKQVGERGEADEEDATKCIKAKGAEARRLDPERQKWQILEPPGDSNKSDNGSFYEDNGVRTVTRIRARRAKWMFPFSLTLPPTPHAAASASP